MIKLKRKIDHLNLNSELFGSGKIKNDIILVESLRESGGFRFKGDIWQSATENLKVETHGKCGFCEEALGSEPPKLFNPSVDHFRPKGKREYRHLAYSYFNFIVACIKCNVNHKNSHFDILGHPIKTPQFKYAISAGKGRASFKYLAPDPFDIYDWDSIQNALLNKAYRSLKNQEKREKPLFINPYFDNPEHFMGYEFVKINKVKSIVIRPLVKQGIKWKRANYTIDKLGLNNDDLSVRRHEEFEVFLNKFRSIETSDRAKSFKKKKWLLLKNEYTRDEQRFAGMFRFYTKDLEKLRTIYLDQKKK